MIGRVLRPRRGQARRDRARSTGAVFRHGFVEDRVEWTLDPDRRAENPAHQRREANSTASRLLECSQCGAVRVGGEPCRHCGFLPQRAAARRCRSATASSAWSIERAAPTATSTIRHERERWHAMLICDRGASAATSRAGRRTSTRKNSAHGRRGAQRRADRADARSPVLGALAHDRLCAEARRMSKRRKISGQFVPRPIEMLRSPAMRVLSLTGASHPRAHRDRTRRARRQGQRAAAGHARRLSRVRHRPPRRRRLGFGKSWRLDLSSRHAAGSLAPPSIAPVSFGSPTCPPTQAGPTDEWRSIGTIEEAEAIAQKARITKPERHCRFNQRGKSFG